MTCRILGGSLIWRRGSVTSAGSRSLAALTSSTAAAVAPAGITCSSRRLNTKHSSTLRDFRNTYAYSITASFPKRGKFPLTLHFSHAPVRGLAFWSRSPPPPPSQSAPPTSPPSSSDTPALTTIYEESTFASPSETIAPIAPTPPDSPSGISPFSDMVSKVTPDLSTATGEGTAVMGMESLTNWPPDLVIRLLESLHEGTGLPYWATIVG
ncbi:hypothetical protein Naga_101565g3, partial [Nannochloropsis gaditana]